MYCLFRSLLCRQAGAAPNWLRKKKSQNNFEIFVTNPEVRFYVWYIAHYFCGRYIEHSTDFTCCYFGHLWFFIHWLNFSYLKRNIKVWCKWRDIQDRDTLWKCLNPRENQNLYPKTFQCKSISTSNTICMYYLWKREYVFRNYFNWTMTYKTNSDIRTSNGFLFTKVYSPKPKLPFYENYHASFNSLPPNM
jgi:hypothetical protein